MLHKAFYYLHYFSDAAVWASSKRELISQELIKYYAERGITKTNYILNRPDSAQEAKVIGTQKRVSRVQKCEKHSKQRESTLLPSPKERKNNISEFKLNSSANSNIYTRMRPGSGKTFWHWRAEQQPHNFESILLSASCNLRHCCFWPRNPVLRRSDMART